MYIPAHTAPPLALTPPPLPPFFSHRYGANLVLWGQDTVNPRLENVGFANALVSSAA